MKRRSLLKYSAAATALMLNPLNPAWVLGQETEQPNKDEGNGDKEEGNGDKEEGNGEKEEKKDEPWLQLAVQQYSFNRQLRKGELKIEDFPKTVVEKTDIKALEFFNGHIEDKVNDKNFFKELRQRIDDLDAVTTLMLCRSRSALDSPEKEVRAKAIEGYRPWMQATKILGGEFIRVDTRSKGDFEEQKKHAVAGLTDLCKVAEEEFEMGILVENHGNFSSNGAWLADVMKKVDLENCGTLPDFQNFTEYDPYQGVEEMMPFAKVLCAKSKSFDDEGNEENVDFHKMLKIARAEKFSGYIGIEFEGHDIDPIEGILATKKLIEKVMQQMAKDEQVAQARAAMIKAMRQMSGKKKK